MLNTCYSIFTFDEHGVRSPFLFVLVVHLKGLLDCLGRSVNPMHNLAVVDFLLVVRVLNAVQALEMPHGQVLLLTRLHVAFSSRNVSWVDTPR